MSNLDTLLTKLESALLSEEKDTDGKQHKRQGIIQSYKDGVIIVKGLEGLRMSEVVTIEGAETKALVMNLEKDLASALVLKTTAGIRENLFVSANNEFLTIKVSDDIIGRIVNPLGEVLDGKSEIQKDKEMPLEKIAPGVIVREPVTQPVQTGILAIDSLIPIGRGQRELIIGDRQTGKTAVAIDTIINQKGKNMICVYVAVSQRESKTAQVVHTFKKHGAMDHTIIVSAPAASSAVLQYLAPYAGTAVAEYFLEKGKDVLIVYDDLSKHAVSYREVSLLLRRPPGREAYPGDVFYLHSRLLERACKLNKDNGSGSITALPIIETLAGDVSAYIPTNVISITDGQIFLESSLFNKGIRPAINVGISVSRVGGNAQTKIMKKISGTLKLDLAQYYELEAFSQFSSELDESTKAQLSRGQAIVEALKQKQYHTYKLWEEVVIIIAATKGYFDKIDKNLILEKSSELLTFVESQKKTLIQKIEKEKEFTDEIAKTINETLEEFFK